MKVTKKADLDLLPPNRVAAAAGSPTEDCELTSDPSITIAPRFSSFVARLEKSAGTEKMEAAASNTANLCAVSPSHTAIRYFCDRLGSPGLVRTAKRKPLYGNNLYIHFL